MQVPLYVCCLYDLPAQRSPSVGTVSQSRGSMGVVRALGGRIPCFVVMTMGAHIFVFVLFFYHVLGI